MRNFTKTAKRINARIGKAIAQYKLIEEGDKILVAVSGGKDSLTLLHFLKKIQGWAPVKFDIYAAHIQTDFAHNQSGNNKELEIIFKELQIEHIFENVSVLDKKEKTNCFWCSWNKRKALFKIASKLKCNKLALGHHKDDIAETVLMNMLCNGEISTMNPKQEMFKGQFTIIRPMCFVEEDTIREFAKENEIPHYTCNCPYGENSKRQYMKDLIKQLSKDIPGYNIKTNICNSIARIKKDYVNWIVEDSDDKNTNEATSTKILHETGGQHVQ